MKRTNLYIAIALPFICLTIACSTRQETAEILSTETAVPKTPTVQLTATTASEPAATATSEPSQTPTSEPTSTPTATNPTPTTTATTEPSPTIDQSKIFTTTQTSYFTHHQSGIAFVVPNGWTVHSIGDETNTITLSNNMLHVDIIIRPTEQVAALEAFTQQFIADKTALETTHQAWTMGQGLTQQAFYGAENKIELALYGSEGSGQYHFFLQPWAIVVHVTPQPEAGGSAGQIQLATLSSVQDLLRGIDILRVYSAKNLPPEPANEDDIYESISDQSPDGRWTTLSRTYWPERDSTGNIIGTTHQQSFIVQSTEDDRSWHAVDQFEQGWGLGLGRYSAVQWHDDRLYFGYKPSPDGGGYASFTDLWQLDLTSGEVQQILGERFGYGITSALSPDGAQLISDPRESDIAIHNLTTHVITHYNLPLLSDLQVNAFAWSPNGRQVLLAASQFSMGESVQQKFVVIDLDKLTANLIAEIPSSRAINMTWGADNTVQVMVAVGDPLQIDLTNSSN